MLKIIKTRNYDKNKRKFRINSNMFGILAVLGLCTCLLLSGTSFAETVHVDKYLQQPETWAAGHVDSLRSNGLLRSDLIKDFDKPLTRMEFAELVVNVYNKAKNQSMDFSKYSESVFTDLNDSYVNEAYELEIVKGVGNGLYDPGSNIERQAVTVMLVRLLKNLKADVAVEDDKIVKFSDDSEIGDWARPSVIHCYKNDIMKGTGGNRISPTSSVTRDEIFTLLNRFCLKYGIIKGGDTGKPATETDPGYYMLNGFKVPRDTSVEVNNSELYSIILTGRFGAKEEEKLWEDMKSILISGGIDGSVIDQYMVIMKETKVKNKVIVSKEDFNKFTLELRADGDIFGFSVLKK